jgi:hypothetical protein
MKAIKPIIVVLFVLLTAQIASAYYCPSTGRWLSRDPIGEPGFEALRAASVVPPVASPVQLQPARWIKRDSIQKLDPRIILADEPDRYLFVMNDSINNKDAFGLRIFGGDMQWQTATCTATCLPCGNTHTFTAKWYGFRVTQAQGQSCCKSAAFIFCNMGGLTWLAQLNFQNCMSSASMPPLIIM